MTVSDTVIVESLWNYIQKFHQWKNTHPCPRCQSHLSEIPFQYRGQNHSFQACRDCYSVVLNSATYQAFRETHRYFKQQPNKIESYPFKRKSEDLFYLIWDRAHYLLTHTKIKKYPATFILGTLTLLAGLITTILPYTATQAMGFKWDQRYHGFENSIALSLLTHADFFHLISNLYFLFLLGSVVEKKIETPKFLVFSIFGLWFSYSIGSLMNPFSNVPSIGMSPLIGSLLGFVWAYKGTRTISLWSMYLVKKTPIQCPMILFGMIFFILELRGALPRTTTPSWFSLTYSIFGLLWGYFTAKIYQSITGETKKVTPILNQALQSRSQNYLKKHSSRAA